jgi:hypothetical protein
MKKSFITTWVFLLLSVILNGYGYSACEGDINCSGTVDGSDLALLAADFGTTGCGTCDDVATLIDELEDRIAQLEALLQNVTRNGDNIYINGANLHIRDGSGTTYGAVNGLGNLIVGYNESRVPYGGTDDRTGSHNIVVGDYQNFSSYGGLVAGSYNTINEGWASVSGGRFNTVSGYAGSVSGGSYNTASRICSSVTGGRYNTASGDYAFVGGGGGELESDGNEAFADYSSILGGWRNIAGDPNFLSTSLGTQSVVSGGSSNIASGDRSAVSGGYDNVASGAGASVSGGKDGVASALGASVSGGNYTTVDDNYDWAAGDLYEPE